MVGLILGGSLVFHEHANQFPLIWARGNWIFFQTMVTHPNNFSLWSVVWPDLGIWSYLEMAPGDFLHLWKSTTLLLGECWSVQWVLEKNVFHAEKFPSCKKNSSKNLLKASNFNDIHGHDDCIWTSDHNCTWIERRNIFNTAAEIKKKKKKSNNYRTNSVWNAKTFRYDKVCMSMHICLCMCPPLYNCVWWHHQAVMSF